MHVAVYHNTVDVVTLLLAHPANGVAEALTLRSNDGDTALDYACMGGHLQVTKLLCGAGADVNAVDDAGWGCLARACEAQKAATVMVPLIEYLVQEMHADVFRATADGLLPIDLVRDVAVRQVLQSAMMKEEADREFLDGGLEF